MQRATKSQLNKQTTNGQIILQLAFKLIRAYQGPETKFKNCQWFYTQE